MTIFTSLLLLVPQYSSYYYYLLYQNDEHHNDPLFKIGIIIAFCYMQTGVS